MRRLLLVSLLAACGPAARVEPVSSVPTPVLSASVPKGPAEVSPPREIDEDPPAGFETRTYDSLPAPDAAFAKQNVSGGACRVGQDVPEPAAARECAIVPSKTLAKQVASDDCSTIAVRPDVLGDDKCIQLFDRSLAQTGKVCIDTTLTTFALSADGKRIALVGRRGDLLSSTYETHVFDTKTGTEIAKLAGASEPIAFSPDGDRIATQARDTVSVWKLPGGAPLAKLVLSDGKQLFGPSPTQLVFSPRGKRLAITLLENDAEYSLGVFDVATGRPSFVQHGLPFLLTAPTFSPDGATLSFGLGQNARVVDAITGEGRGTGTPLYALDYEHPSLSADGESLLLSSQGYLSTWSTRDCKRTGFVRTKTPLRAMHLLPSGDAIGFAIQESIGPTRRIRLSRVSLRDGKSLALEVGEFDESLMALSSDGATFAFLSQFDARLDIVDVGTMRPIAHTDLPGSIVLHALAFADGKLLVSGAKSVLVVDPTTGKIETSRPTPGSHHTLSVAHASTKDVDVECNATSCVVQRGTPSP